MKNNENLLQCTIVDNCGSSDPIYEAKILNKALANLTEGGMVLSRIETVGVFAEDRMGNDGIHVRTYLYYTPAPEEQTLGERMLDMLHEESVEIRRLVLLARRVNVNKFSKLTNNTQRELYLLANNMIVKKDVPYITALLLPELESVLNMDMGD